MFGDDFPIDEVTEKLKVIPTETYKKGDIIPSRTTEVFRKETSWNIGTGYQDSLDVDDQLKQIIGKLHNKTPNIIDIKKDYSLECKFFIVIKIEGENAPSLYIDKEMIEFASSIEANLI